MTATPDRQRSVTTVVVGSDENVPCNVTFQGDAGLIDPDHVGGETLQEVNHGPGNNAEGGQTRKPVPGARRDVDDLRIGADFQTGHGDDERLARASCVATAAARRDRLLVGTDLGVSQEGADRLDDRLIENVLETAGGSLPLRF